VAYNQASPKDASGKPEIDKFLTEADRKVFMDGLMKQCDARDGVADSMIFDPIRCDFDPAVLACKSGQADSCIAPEKIAAIKKAFAPHVSSVSPEARSTVDTRFSSSELRLSARPNIPSGVGQICERNGSLDSEKGIHMKLTRWMATTFAGLLSIAALASGAAAHDKPQEPAREVHLVTASTPRERQIDLALSAAPTEVSSEASVNILGPKGYEKLREGTNGFSCLIERSFKGTTQTSSAPACFDAEGSGSILLAYLRREEMRAEGKSEEEVKETLRRDIRMADSKCLGRVSFT
jgi:hypothetical protein